MGGKKVWDIEKLMIVCRNKIIITKKIVEIDICSDVPADARAHESAQDLGRDTAGNRRRGSMQVRLVTQILKP